MIEWMLANAMPWIIGVVTMTAFVLLSASLAWLVLHAYDWLNRGVKRKKILRRRRYTS